MKKQKDNWQGFEEDINVKKVEVCGINDLTFLTTRKKNEHPYDYKKDDSDYVDYCLKGESKKSINKSIDEDAKFYKLPLLKYGEKFTVEKPFIDDLLEFYFVFPNKLNEDELSAIREFVLDVNLEFEKLSENTGLTVGYIKEKYWQLFDEVFIKKIECDGNYYITTRNSFEYPWLTLEKESTDYALSYNFDEKDYFNLGVYEGCNLDEIITIQDNFNVMLPSEDEINEYTCFLKNKSKEMYNTLKSLNNNIEQEDVEDFIGDEDFNTVMRVRFDYDKDGNPVIKVIDDSEDEEKREEKREDNEKVTQDLINELTGHFISEDILSAVLKTLGLVSDFYTVDSYDEEDNNEAQDPQKELLNYFDENLIKMFSIVFERISKEMQDFESEEEYKELEEEFFEWLLNVLKSDSEEYDEIKNKVYYINWLNSIFNYDEREDQVFEDESEGENEGDEDDFISWYFKNYMSEEDEDEDEEVFEDLKEKLLDSLNIKFNDFKTEASKLISEKIKEYQEDESEVKEEDRGFRIKFNTTKC